MGARLFEAIVELDEYYLTRTEVGILEEKAGEIARIVGPRAVLIEPGAGAATKSELLLEKLDNPAQWVPVDVAGKQLAGSAARIQRRFPKLSVQPAVGDYHAMLPLPKAPADAGSRVVFFPGSTIGNFDPTEAVEFLGRMRELADLVIVGVDLEKDPSVLELAYDDPQGVTAAFGCNMLAHTNTIAGTDFEVPAWRHRATWNAAEHRMEAHLVAERATQVRVGDESFAFEAGDAIWVESSYKYTRESFARLAGKAGLSVKHVWTDDQSWFGVVLLARA